MRFTIWCNSHFRPAAEQILREGTAEHNLVLSTAARVSQVAGGNSDPLLESADIALGQPDPAQIVSCQRLRWVQLDSAGYTRYDRVDVRDVLESRGAMMTNCSSVYREPCAQHLLTMMLSQARQFPQSLVDQQTTRVWRYTEHRRNSLLLGPDQTVLILGFGSIAKRLVELLQPFGVKIIASRRTPRADELIRVVPESEADALLPTADHVINILPDNPGTKHYFNSARFGRMKPTALFYNIGRGTTVDQEALISGLCNRQIAGAFLDVTDPEPLPPEHLLWRAPNCFITPHTGGGHHDEFERIVRHFLRNLERFSRNQVLEDRII